MTIFNGEHKMKHDFKVGDRVVNIHAKELATVVDVDSVGYSVTIRYDDGFVASYMYNVLKHV